MTRIIEPNDSILNYYLLPLLGINKHSFGERFFINSYLKTATELVVVLNEGTPVRYWEFNYFKTDYNKDGKVIVIFEISGKFRSDLQLIIDGKFSKMSNFAKDLIYKNSGLFYKKKLGDAIITSKILLVLTKSEKLKDWFQEEYGCFIEDDEEFIPKPGKEIYYNTF